MTGQEPEPYVLAGWRRAVPSVTDTEVRALLPLLRDRGGRLHEIIAAYRLGKREAATLPPPLAGFQPCPNCLSVSVAGVTLGSAEPGHTGIVARCGHCGWRFYAGTGEPYRTDSPDADRDQAAPTQDNRGPGG